ncbi:MAG: metallophosphoesterase [Candidatus Binatia bacterium]|nr:metallophosphoesterase [Candidatus Binatia bacterium]MDG1959812.1 metallophosphoesterase [Candidatus Binatia bacterium]MDG2010127.1 metallophosphoesterase [Candidatus Binatia bacterium]HAC81770.1 hypothetical protein [Deltaproteobacteria bacterium]
MPRIRVLQTSDLQMSPDRPESLRALDLILATARERAADMVIIAGDLIDRNADPSLMAPIIRSALERSAPLPVVILPGHDDHAAFDETTDLGANAVRLHQMPVHKATVCGLDIVGVPWQRGRTLAECLIGVAMDPRHTVLVAHATLATGLTNAFCGEGAEGAFMPAFADDLFRRCTYAALGHVHAGENLIYREGERLVAYSGSPIAHSPRELGQRGVLLVDFESSIGVVDHTFVPLPTRSYALVEENCLPGEEAAAINRIVRRTNESRMPGVCIRARLSGIALLSAPSLRASLEDAIRQNSQNNLDGDELSEPNVRIEVDITDFSGLADIPVVAEFIEKMRVSPENPHGASENVLRAALEIGLHSFREALP